VRRWVLTPAEYQTLVELCRVADRLDALDRAIAEQGLIISGSRNQPKANPLLAELRETQRTMSRLVAELDLPDPHPLWSDHGALA
jgi:phage terminase small subunit